MGKILYKKAAETWVECLPLGNGNIGMMLDGGVFREKIFLNDDTLWTGHPQTHSFSHFLPKNLEKIRGLIYKGHHLTAEKVLKASLLGSQEEAYLPFGTIFIDYKIDGKVDDYTRALDLDKSIYTSKFKIDGNVVEKRSFCSFPDSVGVFNIRSVHKISFLVSFDTSISHETHVEKDILYVTGHAPDSATKIATIPVIGTVKLPFATSEYNGKGMAFAGGFRVVTDGKITDEGGALSIQEATNTTLILKTSTGYKGYNEKPENRTEFVKRKVKEFLSKNFLFDFLFDRHVKDYTFIYNRTNLKLTKQIDGIKLEDYTCFEEDSTEDEIAKLKKTGVSLKYIETYYNFGRYLMISASRQNCQPIGMHGIWSREIKQGSVAEFKINKTLQMYYRMAPSCNLVECIEPLINFTKELLQNGKKTAHDLFGASGFCAFPTTDIWKKTSPGRGDLCDVFFPLSGVWLTNELYSCYTYTKNYNDENLNNETRSLLDIMEESCRFANEWLVYYNEKYITCPSTTPELKFKGKIFSQNINSASSCDLSIIWQLIDNYEEICNKFELNTQLLKELTEKKNQIAPLKAGKNGLYEWDNDLAVAENTHNLVALYPLYPGNRINAGDENNKEILKGCEKLLNTRVKNTGLLSGVYAGWAICLYSRLEEGNSAYEVLKRLIEQNHTLNIFEKYSIEEFQIDGNIGAVLGINEMLAKSDGEKITLLPSLPDAFKEGRISGLTVKGGFVIDMVWSDKKVKNVEVRRLDCLDIKIKIVDKNLQEGIYLNSNIQIVV